MNALSALLKNDEPIQPNSVELTMNIEFEEIGINDTPKRERWVLSELRKISLTDAEIMWQIGFDAENLITWHGHVGGKIQREIRVVELNLSGKNIQSQALQEARKKYIDKIRDGYTPPGANNEPLLTIMSGIEYEPNKTKLNFPVGTETKLDGVRIWIRRSHGIIEGFSRGNIPFIRMKHLFSEVDELFNYLPYNCAIDCEMYHPKLKFQELISVVRTTDFNHSLLPMLELYIFDLYLIDNPPFEMRRYTLEKAMKTYRQDKFGHCPQGMVGGRHEEIADNRTKEDYLSLNASLYPKDAIPNGKTKLFLTTLYNVFSHDQIQQAHDYFVSMGYEGSMIKKYSNGAAIGTKEYKESQYLFGRGSHILKYKYFITKEAKCVDVKEAKGREEGCALLILEDENNNRFSVRMKGSFERRREWLLHPERVLNRPVTYKYQELTDDGIPRFPVGIDVRDYE